MLIARTVMVESGLGGRFWFRAATAGKDARNVTFNERIGMTPYQAMYGEKKDVSDYRAFGCRAYVYENKQRQANGKHTPRAKEAIYVGFVPNMSGHSGSRRTRKSVQRTKPGSMSANSPTGRGRWWSNICLIIPLIFCFNKLAMSNGFRTIS